MSLPQPSSDYELKIVKSIDKSGYFLTGVLKGDNDPAFLYSIGLWHSHGHPEFVIFGLHRDAAARVGQVVAQRIVDGYSYKHGEIDPDLINGYDCMFLDVPRSLTSRWMRSDVWLYGAENFPVYQIVYQDEGHRWPWDDDAPIHFLRNQPMLGKRS